MQEAKERIERRKSFPITGFLINGQQHPQSTVKDGNYEDFVIAVTR